MVHTTKKKLEIKVSEKSKALERIMPGGLPPIYWCFTATGVAS